MSRKNQNTDVAGVYEIANIMRDEYGVLVKESTESIKQVFDAIGIALKKYKAVHIKGYMKISKRLIAEHNGRNPKTGEVVKVPEHEELYFKSGTILKSAIKSEE